MAPYHLTEQIKHQIVNLHREGVSNTDISDELGISVSKKMGNYLQYSYLQAWLLKGDV